MEAATRSLQRPSRSLVSRLRCAHPRPSAPSILRSRTLRSSINPSPRTVVPPHAPHALRFFSTVPSQPKFAEGSDVEHLRTGLSVVTERGWTLDEEGSGIKKTFYFRTYFKAVSFVNVIASQSAAKKHHATMTVRLGSVDVHWTTHHPRGLTDKDLTMAHHCEQAAEVIGVVEEGQGRKCGPPPSGGA